MQTVPITADGPMLEGVLGPLTEAQDRAARDASIRAGGRLDVTAARLGGRVGWHGSGLEVHWLPSGQMSIWGSVEAHDGPSRAVAFILELRPSWFYGVRTGVPAWDVDVVVEVDCQHSPDHGSMHNVFEQTHSAASVSDAIAAFTSAVETLEDLARQPLSEWAAKGGH